MSAFSGLDTAGTGALEPACYIPVGLRTKEQHDQCLRAQGTTNTRIFLVLLGLAAVSGAAWYAAKRRVPGPRVLLGATAATALGALVLKLGDRVARSEWQGQQLALQAARQRPEDAKHLWDRQNADANTAMASSMISSATDVTRLFLGR